jgi:co-chaperonin GroES (HSP10)
MAINLNTIKGKLSPVGNRVIVENMYFGEQKTKAGLIITNDDGNVRGIYPRWGQVYAKGPRNTDPYEVGDWILIEHGRWTRSVNLDDGNGEKDLRMIETESILGWSKTKPEDVFYGKSSTADFTPDKITADAFV